MIGLESISKNDVVVLDPRSDMGEPFKGSVKEKRTRELIIRPNQHSLDSDVLAINISEDLNQFTVLINGAEKDTKVFSVSSIRVYDESGDKIYSSNIAEGDVVHDTESPNWSDDNRVEVTEVTEKLCKECTIEGSNTVADFNPDYPSDDNVIKAEYVGGNKEYSFPESRLSIEEPEKE